MSNLADILPSRFCDLLQRTNVISLTDVLFMPRIPHFKAMATAGDIDSLKRSAAASLLKDFGCDIDKKICRALSFGCRSLDLITNGGIFTRGITEICGESGSGKTQILLQLALMVQLSNSNGGLNSGAIFICTEDSFSSKRLFQMQDAIKKRYSESTKEFSENIFIEHIRDSDKLLHCVQYTLPLMLSKTPIKLVIIDSIAAIFRTQSNIVHRSIYMRKLATKLLHLADKYGCAIVCSNQVSNRLADDINKESDLIPCLGLSWSSLVRCRIFISRTKATNSSAVSSHRSYERQAKVIFSPEIKTNIGNFVIVQDGVMDVGCS